MEIKFAIVNRVATLTLVGHFNFRVKSEFHDSVSRLHKLDWDSLEVDFNDVTNIDSSALGMLLILKEKTTSAGRQLSLINCKGVVKSVFGISNFQKVFNITGPT